MTTVVPQTANNKLNKPVLNLGASGAAVRELQRLLLDYSNYIGARAINPSSSDGVFGDRTLQAVLAFQQQVFLPRTGTVADLTWRSLYKRGPVDLPTVKYGEVSDYVALLEDRLVTLNYLAASANRQYDQRTLKAVSAFQKDAGLPQRSSVDEAMWFALSKRVAVFIAD
jgi:peptidoglycan hydrolase-like protein with peptidoglycan-binding domain